MEKEKKEQREREKKENEMKKKFKVSQAVKPLAGRLFLSSLAEMALCPLLHLAVKYSLFSVWDCFISHWTTLKAINTLEKLGR